MRYCFIRELLDIVEASDSYQIQHQYALKIEKCLEYSIKEDCFFDGNKEKVDTPRVMIMWIGDCKYVTKMDEVTEKYKINAIDNAYTRKKIQCWYQYGTTKRKIFTLKGTALLNYAKNNDLFFIKTMTKNRSAIIKNGNTRAVETWGNQDEYIISEYQDILEDILGKKEVRFVVLNGRILNGSRYIHSLFHVVDSKFYKEAKRIKQKIDNLKCFPTSYVMDIALFADKYGNEYYDLVEINSISTALCYVNNSFFEEIVPEIAEIYKKTNWGYEYCYDYLQNENMYFFKTDRPKDFLYYRET